ncbi:MAG: galactose oxidase-like domain-containing protein [Actinomycetota bacterium]
MAQFNMYYIDPDANAGDGTITQIGDFPTDNMGATSVSVMFDEGKVLQFGGGQFTNTYNPPDGSKKTSIIDLNQDLPVITQVADMNLSRHWADGIVLPDGTVLAVGGSRENNREDLGGVAFAPEIYDPLANTWTLMEANSTPRLYHSSAALLPDGSVFVGGGGAAGSSIPNYPSAEVFLPPYLYDANDNLAVRPTITSAPAEIGYGHTFTVDVSGNVDRVTLLKVNTATHSMNTQNFNELAFQRSGDTLTIDAPTLVTVATPGDYQLFVLDSNGVPSVAAMMRVSHTYTPPPVVEANIVTNGSFEQNDVADGTAGDVEAPGWTTSRPDNAVPTTPSPSGMTTTG